MPLLAEVVNGRWRPTIGDPTVYGWATVAVYLWAVFFCALCVRWSARLCPGKGRRLYILFWAGLALGLALMAVNKQLDLQGLFGVWARKLAHAQGWYEDRRAYQQMFIRAMAVGGVVVVAVLAVVMRGLLRQTWLAVLGLGVLLGFVMIRAASFHSVDQLLGVRIGGVAVNWLLEWSGILLIVAGALMNLLAQPKTPTNPARPAQSRPRDSR